MIFLLVSLLFSGKLSFDLAELRTEFHDLLSGTVEVLLQLANFARVVLVFEHVSVLVLFVLSAEAEKTLLRVRLGYLLLQKLDALKGFPRV